MSATVASQTVRGVTSIAAGDTVGNTTTATVFSSVWAMPTSFLTVGRCLRLTARGTYSTAAALAGNLTIDVMGGTTVLCSTGAQALSVGLGNDGWEIKADVIGVTTGAAGAVEAQGLAVFQTAAITANPVFMSNTAGVSLSTGVTQNIGLQVTWSATGNTITQRQLFVDIGGLQ